METATLAELEELFDGGTVQTIGFRGTIATVTFNDRSVRYYTLGAAK